MTHGRITSLHIHALPVLDQDEALDFYTTHLGFEVRDDIDLGFMRWLTIGVPGQDTSVLLELRALEHRFDQSLSGDCAPEKCFSKGCVYREHAAVDLPR